MKMSQLDEMSTVVRSRARTDFGFLKMAAHSPHRFCQARTGRRTRGDQTTRCMTISKAGTSCSCFQYMGLTPQMMKAAAVKKTPEDDSRGRICAGKALIASFRLQGAALRFGHRSTAPTSAGAIHEPPLPQVSKVRVMSLTFQRFGL